MKENGYKRSDVLIDWWFGPGLLGATVDEFELEFVEDDFEYRKNKMANK